MFESWPFTNFHDLNLDWLVGKWKKLEDNLDDIHDSMEAAAASENSAASSATQAAASRIGAASSAAAAANSAESIENSARQIAVNSARIDNLIANAGDSAIPSELVDIRVAYDGVTYTTAGDAVRVQAADAEKRIGVLYNISEKGNFYSEQLALQRKDIQSSNGAIVTNNSYKVSDKIYMDFTKPIWTSGVYSSYVYCYGDSDTYYGRVNIETQNRYILTIYPDTKYIRTVSTLNTSNVMVTYWDYRPDEYVPYMPIEGWIEDSPYIEKVANQAREIRVLTYNMGNFTGAGLTPDTEATKNVYKNTIGNIKPNIAAFQFDVGLMNSRLPSEYIYNNFREKSQHGNRNYDYFGQASDFTYENRTPIDYNEGVAFTHSYFLTIDLNIGDKTVKLIDVHFEWRDNTQRASQINQVLSYAANHEYCIIAGDFNPYDYVNGVRQSTNMTYAEDLQTFIDAGFTPANAGDFGIFNTIADDSIPSDQGPCDNILVKGNMVIKNVDTLERTFMNDHYPLYADIVIY